jgi:hypothetical protein
MMGPAISGFKQGGIKMKAAWIARIGMLFLCAAPACSELITGDGYSFFLSAPLGWVLDKSLASEAEADVVLYPKGSTYQNAASILTVSAVIKGEGFKDLKDLLKHDEEDGRQQNPKFSVEKGPILRTHLEQSVLLYYYRGMKDGGSEAVAYLDEQDHIMLFVLSSSNESILHEDLPALQEAVESYQFIAQPQQDP